MTTTTTRFTKIADAKAGDTVLLEYRKQLHPYTVSRVTAKRLVVDGTAFDRSTGNSVGGHAFGHLVDPTPDNLNRLERQLAESNRRAEEGLRQQQAEEQKRRDFARRAAQDIASAVKDNPEDAADLFIRLADAYSMI